MKKTLILSILAGLVISPVVVLADPTPITLNFTCPNTTGVGANSLSNFGSRIAGYGTLIIANIPGRDPYFTYAIPGGANIPSKLNTGSYKSSGTDYDPVQAIVSCSYTSSTFSPFTVMYQLTNGNGGTVASQTVNNIVINQYIGIASR